LSQISGNFLKNNNFGWRKISRNLGRNLPKTEGNFGTETNKFNLMKQDKLRVISAKDLGRLNMSDFCPRCFWIERHIGKPPAVFPGIFSTLDAVTKRSTQRSFSENGRIPAWLPVPDLVEVEEGDIYFKLPVGHGDWTLIGKPDDIFRRGDNTYHIIDYKTAKFTHRQDELFPLYEVQLNCYAYLAEKYGFKPVSKLSLVYCQPNEELDDDEDFKLGFKAYQVEVDLKPSIVPELLLKAREILNQNELPKNYCNCKGICQWMDKAFKKAF
jgi:hypothetical protein